VRYVLSISLIACFLGVLIGLPDQAIGFSNTYDDLNNYWTGWGNTEDDGSDTVGTPNFDKTIITGNSETGLLETISVTEIG